MGGNLFTTTRLEATEYEALEREVLSILLLHISKNVKALKYYKNKPSFGDMDILIESDKLSPDWKKRVKSLFVLSDEDCNSNGNVFSFKYKNFQIDLITMSSQYFESAYNYYAYNDLGNLLGRLTHKMGVKLGHKGLEIVVRPSNFRDHIIGEISISTNFTDALNLLGLSVDRYNQGFNDRTEIYEYVASSPYFNPSIYLLDNRNAHSRIRDKKRETYNKFLDWCEINKDKLNKFDFGTVVERGGYSIREPWYSDGILRMFPFVETEVNNLIYEYEQNQKLKGKLSGGLVMELTGLHGKDLGVFFKKVKETLESRYTREQLIDMEQSIINNMIRAIKFCDEHGFDYPKVPFDFAVKYVRGELTTLQ